jgi:thymidylate synthase ThyX
VRQVIADQNPRQVDESEAAWERRIRADYIDVCRFLLPAASLANVGVTINARSLEYAIAKMLSHPLMEVNAIGQEIKTVAQQEVPTLVKYADESSYLIESRQVFTSLASRIVVENPASTDWCSLLNYDHQAEERILASAIFRFGYPSYAQALGYIQSLTAHERQRLAHNLLGKANRHQQPIRELEHSSYTFELTLDQGAYFELKRHRMMTITAQPLSTLLGYAVPRVMVEAGMENAYRKAMEAANNTYGMLTRFNPELASYVVPNGYNRRILMTMNLRNADHFCALRANPNAHFSMRRVAHRVAEHIRQATPMLGQFLHLPANETWQEIENQYFSQTA